MQNQKTDKLKKKKVTHNCQKIKLYGGLTTKELKKKRSSRFIGGTEDWQQGSGWRTRAGEAEAGRWGGKTGERDRPYNPGFQCRETEPQNL